MSEEKTPPKAAVIGTGRSGSGYVAALLRLVPGASIGHEDFWGPRVMADGPDGDERRVGGLDVDCSWLALPDIESMNWSGPVVHVIREPVACIKSLAELGLFGGDAAPHPFRDFVREQVPMTARLSRVEAATHWYHVWNARCAAVADVTIQLEDLPGVDLRLAPALGLPPWSVELIEAGLAIRKDTNHTPRGYDAEQRGEVSVTEVLYAIRQFGLIR